MFSDSSPRIPLKGPIFVYSAIALALGAWAHLAQRHVDKLQRATDIKEQITQADVDAGMVPPLDLGSPESLEDQLAPYMPTAGLGGLGLGGQSLGDTGLAGEGLFDEEKGPRRAGDVPKPSYLMTPEELRKRREESEEGYVYPRFDTRGRHGAPIEASPRNVTVELVDVHDEPIVATSLRVIQTGDDGEFEPNAYRSFKDPTKWTIGSPLLTPGAAVTFELSARGENGRYFMIKRVSSVPERGDVELGQVRLGRRDAEETEALR